MPKKSKEFWLIILAFFIIYIVWGTTYLANAWGLKSVPPFLYAAARFVLAGVLLLGISRLFGPIRITRKQLLNCLFAGVFLFTIGNGMVVWALQHIDSGITALFVAFEPLIVAIMLWQWKGEKPKRDTWLGIALGVFGMALLIGQPNFVSSQYFFYGILAVMSALLAWGYIAIWIPDADVPKSILQRASWQMIMGGLGLFILGVVVGEPDRFHVENINSTAIWCFAYLVVFGSILAFTSFNYLLQKVSPTKVVTSAYVNPVVAVIVGWWLNNEVLSTQSILAASILLLGVFFINRAKGKKSKA